MKKLSEKKTDLLNQVNIGKDTATKLKLVGIDSVEELKQVGTEQAFIRLQTLDPGACLCLLYGLDGAVNDIKSNLIPTARKQELKEFYKMVKK
jgi:DNA transformation protein